MIDIYAALEPFSINDRYLKRYVDFIQSRPQHVDCKVESHHILPKAKDLFPQYKKSKWNLINLTLREHFIAHWMLARAVGKSQVRAFWGMCTKWGRADSGYKVNSRAYAEGKTLASKIMSNRVVTDETRKRQSDTLKGTTIVRWADGRNDNKFRIQCDDPRYLSGELIGHTRGNTFTTDQKRKMAEAHRGVKHTDETKAKMSIAHKGKKKTDEHKLAISKSHNKVYVCPHCKKTGGRMMLRWHFDKCRYK